MIEVLESTVGLGLRDVRIRFLGEPLHFAVGPGLLGRVFNGVGRPVDGGPPVAADNACVSMAFRSIRRCASCRRTSSRPASPRST